MRWALRLLIGIVILVVAIGIAADLFARSEAQKVLANRVRDSTKAEAVSVHIGSFPFLYDVLASSIPDVKIVAGGVPVGPLRVSQVTVDARNVKVDRHSLLLDRKLVVSSIGSATVTAVVKNAGLSTIAGALGAQVSIANGHVLVVTVAGRQLLSVDMSSNRLIPDCPLTIDTIPDGYSLSCSVSPVPASLLSTFSGKKL